MAVLLPRLYSDGDWLHSSISSSLQFSAASQYKADNEHAKMNGKCSTMIQWHRSVVKHKRSGSVSSSHQTVLDYVLDYYYVNDF